MEHEYYFNFDIVPSDIWRLIFKQLRTLTDLRSANLVNKLWHNYSKYHIQQEKIWLEFCKTRFGLAETKFIGSILPSKLFILKQMLRPTLNLTNKNISVDDPLKILVIGDGGCGKTSFIRLVTGGRVEKVYIPTFATETCKFKVFSTNRTFELVLWDKSDNIRGDPGNGYYGGSAAAIIVSDVTFPMSLKNTAQFWIRGVRRVCGDIPIAVCVNKMDRQPDNFTPEGLRSRFINIIRASQKNNTMFCEMSNWAKYGVHEPLIWILQQLTGDETLELKFPPLSSDYHAEINSEVMAAALSARKEALKYRVESADDLDEIFVPNPDYALKKQKIREQIVKAIAKK